MFKNLKSKLEDEAKRLHVTMSHYGDNLAQQVRSGASDAGSDISGYTRRLFSNSNNEESQINNRINPHPTIRKLSNDNLISLDDNDSEQINSSVCIFELIMD